MTRRLFNSGERVALYLASEGRCTRCGRKLEKGFHADHEQPFSQGGETDVANGQALCPNCNLSKGGKVMEGLRNWQNRAILQFMADRPPNFLCEATPAAGKTRVAAELAFRLRAAELTPRIITVVPTRRLRKQTADKYRRDCGLQLHYQWKPGDGVFPHGEYCGAVVTYSTIAQNVALFRKFCSDEPTLAVLDEIHHAHIERDWGSALFNAFEPAVHRLLLSGTPFRSDDGAIPFVRYVDGKGIADFSYGYDQALADEIVRAAYFPRFGGSMEWIDGEGHKSANFNDDLDERGQSRRLRTALTAGEHLSGMLRQAHSDLLQMREDDPDAAGLVLAIDQDHAAEVARKMQRDLGVDPIVAISDDPAADRLIEDFESSAAPWIVAVRMITEGVDIRRLRACVFATNIVTEMFFRQAVGRIVRREDDHEQHWAHFYIPDDARLRQFATDIMKQREMVMGTTGGDDEGGEGAPKPASLFLPLSSTIELAGGVAGPYLFTPTELAFAERVKLSNRETAGDTTLHVALLLRAANPNFASGGAAAAEGASEADDLTARIKKSRNKNDKLAKAIAMRWGIEYRQVNETLNRLVGIRSVKVCFVAETLERRAAFAERWLAFGDFREAANA
jgi:superfamily II DNA or RNA helicase